MAERKRGTGRGARAVSTALDVQEVRGELHHAGTGEPSAVAHASAAPRLSGLRARISAWRMRGVSPEVDTFGLDPLFSVRWAPALDALYSRWWHVELQGLENVPAQGRAMLVGNHSGGLPYDGLMLMHGVRRDHPAHRLARVLVEDDFWNLPFAGSALARLGCVRANPDNAERLLRDEQLLAVFPEGTRGLAKTFAERYRLQRFGRGGFVRLALRTRTPILPVAIVGAEEIHPVVARIPLPLPVAGLSFLPVTPTFPSLGPLGLVPLPTRWTIRVGPPVELPHRASGAPDAQELAELTERVRSTVQDMVKDILAWRGGNVVE